MMPTMNIRICCILPASSLLADESVPQRSSSAVPKSFASWRVSVSSDTSSLLGVTALRALSFGRSACSWAFRTLLVSLSLSPSSAP